jgi:flagellin
MSVVINTNSAATMAATNLANSSALLQKSLNRLSSGSRIVSPDDDAGGLAVSMKLTSTIHQQAAVQNNIASSVSFLQTQDGALNMVGKVLSRIGELKTLYADPTKNSSDLANYNDEFVQLQSEITSLSNEKFNGISLFGSSGLNVGVTADAGGSTVNVGAAALLGSSGSPWSNVGMSASDWTASDPNIINPMGSSGLGALVTSGTPTIAFHQSAIATYSTNQSITGPFTLAFDTSTNGPTGFSTYSPMSISAGGNSVDLTALLGAGGNDHHVSITDDGTNASISIDGGSATVVASLATGGGSPFVFTNNGSSADFHVANLALTNTGGSGSSNVGSVANASDLGSASLSTITSALQEVATMRANNGAQQSRLGFASEVLTANKANLEAANSRITDVDVAAESTQLARYNILVQAGTSMLSQANQSSQMALKLLG